MLKELYIENANLNSPMPGYSANYFDENSVQDVLEVDERPDVYNAMDDYLYILRQGSRLGYHVLAITNSLADFKQSGIKMDLFRHRISFQISKDDSWEMFENGLAAGMPEHICRYSDTINTFSFRPYLHKEFTWDGWSINEQGIAINKF